MVELLTIALKRRSIEFTCCVPSWCSLVGLDSCAAEHHPVEQSRNGISFAKSLRKAVHTDWVTDDMPPVERAQDYSTLMAAFVRCASGKRFRSRPILIVQYQ